jgi:hypothetical protein
MISLRTFALDQQQSHFRRDAVMLWQAQSLLKELDGRLQQVADEWLSAMVQHDRLDYALWLRWRRSFVNALHRVIKDQYEQIAKLAQVYQQQGFLVMRDGLVSLLATLYPANVVTVPEIPVTSLDFREMPLSLMFPDRELRKLVQEAMTCAHCAEDMVHALVWESVGVWQEYGQATLGLTEADPVTITIGTGKLAPEFLRFLRDQVDADLDPGRLITTLSTEHLKFVQGVLLGAMIKGQDLGWTKDRIMQHLTTEWETADPRHGQAYHVMRVLRTSHNRAVNAAVAYFAQQNPVVAEMERVADGRPCVACCPPSTLVHVGGRYHLIDAVHVGDMILTHMGRQRRVTATMQRSYRGELVVLHDGVGRILKVTPEHHVLTPGGWVPAGALTVTSMVQTDAPLGGHHTQRVMSIERIDYDGWVYNLEVEEDESYYANGFAVHNCLIMDGTRYPLGVPLIDHPNGMCLLTPVVKSLEDLGFDRASLPKEAQVAWTRQERPHPPMWMQFHDLAEVDQQRIMGKAVHALWQAERFPLEALVTKKQGWFVPKTATELRATLPDLGGLSYPKIRLGTATDGSYRASTAADRALLTPLDSRDRADAERVFLRMAVKDAPDEAGIYGQNLFGMGLDGQIPDGVRAQADDWLFSLRGKLSADPVERAQQIAGVPWQEFNERARVLGLYLRKDVEGRFYHAVDRRDFLRIFARPMVVTGPPQTWQEVVVVQKAALEPLLQAYIRQISPEMGQHVERYFAGGGTWQDLGMTVADLFPFDRWSPDQEPLTEFYRASWKEPIQVMLSQFLKKIAPRVLRSAGDETLPLGVVTTSLGRGYHWAGRIALSDLSQDQLLHEFGHFLEYRNLHVQTLLRDFYRDRTRGERAVSLRSLYDDHFEETEQTKRDRWMDAYVGKVYPKVGHSEVLSMGLPYFVSLQKMLTFWQADPEHFYLIAGILRGQIPGL